MSWWRNIRKKIADCMGSDEHVVHKVERLDARQKEIGHDIANIQMKIDPLREMVNRMRDDNDINQKEQQNG